MRYLTRTNQAPKVRKLTEMLIGVQLVIASIRKGRRKSEMQRRQERQNVNNGDCARRRIYGEIEKRGSRDTARNSSIVSHTPITIKERENIN